MPDEPLIIITPYALLYTRAGAGVCLQDPLTGKTGVLFMDLREGMALEHALTGESPDRPDSPTLLLNTLDALECKPRLALIHARKDEVFYARVKVEASNEVMEKLIELDARPSDALRVAVHFGIPCKITASVWDSMENIRPQLEQLHTDSPDSRAPVYVKDL